MASGVSPARIEACLPALDIGRLQELGNDGRFYLLVAGQRLIPAVANYLEAHGVPGSKFSRATQLFSKTNEIQKRTLLPVLSSLSRSSVNFTAIKGTALHFIHCENSSDLPRHMVDFDFLISLVELESVLKAFEAGGFTAGSLDRKNMIFVAATSEDQRALLDSHYELSLQCNLVKAPELAEYADLIRELDMNPYLLVHNTVYVSVACDLHFNLASEFDIRDLWNSLSPLTIERYQFTRMTNADLVWFLATRCYNEVFQLNKFNLRQFFDVLTSLRIFKGKMDWGRLEEVCDRYDLYVPLFYVLNRCHELEPELVPSEIISRLKSALLSGNNRRNNDYGDFLPRMVGQISVPKIFNN